MTTSTRAAAFMTRKDVRRERRHGAGRRQAPSRQRAADKAPGDDAARQEGGGTASSDADREWQAMSSSNPDEGRGGSNVRRSTRLTVAVKKSTPPTSTRSQCEWCEALFEPLNKRQRFCSNRCRYAHRDSARYRPRGTVVESVCVDCSRSFVYLSSTKPRRRCDDCRSNAGGGGASDLRNLVAQDPSPSHGRTAAKLANPVRGHDV